MISELIDRLVTYGTPAFLIIHELLKKLATNPELHAKVAGELIKVAKDKRTRTDELLFITSLIVLKGVSFANRQLFWQKHHELCKPDLAGKTPEQIKKLREKQKLAEGLIFLIAEDKTAGDKEKPFQFAEKVWKGMFMGIKSLPGDAKLQIFEQRILYFGKNHQERATLEEVIEKLQPYWEKVDSAADSVGGVISNATRWVNQQYNEREIRRARRRNMTFWQRFNPAIIWQSFTDQF